MLTLDTDALKALIVSAVRDAVGDLKTSDGPERWLSIAEAAEVLSLGETKVRELISQGRLRSVQVDSARRIPVSAMKEFQEQASA